MDKNTQTEPETSSSYDAINAQRVKAYVCLIEESLTSYAGYT